MNITNVFFSHILKYIFKIFLSEHSPDLPHAALAFGACVFVTPTTRQQTLLEILFPDNLLTSTEQKQNQNQEKEPQKIYSKPRLMQITKITTMQNNHTSGIQKYYNSK